jgi:hypothetical protein
MRRIIPLSILVLIMAAGSAMAERRHDGRHDNRSNYSQRNNSQRNYTRNDARWNNGRRSYVAQTRRPVHVSNGHYRFNNGYSVRYSRPTFNVRYTNYRVRPVLYVENYQPVPGYIWVRGNWNWNGYEWIWVSGHYAVDASYAY